jgi:two-component system NtrC family response regulator
MPPLRVRRADIPLLVDHFVRRHALRLGKRIEGVAPDALALMTSAPWPGNVRELENAVERAVVLTPHRVVQAGDLMLLGASHASDDSLPSLNLKQNLDWIERETLARALEASRGVKKDAAEVMGISQRALSYYLAKHRPDEPAA